MECLDKSGVYCRAYLLDAPYHIDRPFDYTATSAEPGDIVRLPFGRSNTLRLGVITEVSGEPPSSLDPSIPLKAVHSTVYPTFALTKEMLGLCLFLKEYTLCSFGDAVRAILPPGALSGAVNVKLGKRCFLNEPEEKIAEVLSASGRAGIRSEGQRDILKFLLSAGSADWELIRQIPGTTGAQLKALTDRGLVRVSEEEELRNPYASYAQRRDTSEIVLSEEQSKAYATIEELYKEDTARACLLFGVTGSGKTKVIMKAIDRTLADGKTVIMLVPEISLTPQTVNIFCTRYGERVAVVHSSLSQGERTDAWRRIRRGDVDLVIGTRSAIFAPLDNIGLIVIDEEHEHTYKSESDPKYHARDVAAYRAGKHSALMLLASATPSLESFYKAKEGKYSLVTLKQRYGGFKLPRAVVVDMREELRQGNLTPLSKRLTDSLGGVKARGEQAIIFLNRRGYSTQVSCKDCGEVLSCKRCSVSLTYHTGRDGGRLLCHMCGYSTPAMKICPGCGSDKLSFLGFGTQKLESELSKYLPNMPVMRMDADTTQGKLAYDRMLEDFREGRADLLLGTQMVAKGHDFPKVTLVGVALADTSLFLSDFRAAERAFSLLTQVIGRAGRAKENGTAVIQTFAPFNETLRLACKQDYESFYEGEIAIRRELSYPPFCDIVQLTLTADSESELFGASERLGALIKEKMSGKYSGLPFVVYGPFEAQVYKLNEKYRMRTVVKCRINAHSRRLFSELLCDFAKERTVTLAVDINPLTV